jgi:hypothetical protein
MEEAFQESSKLLLSGYDAYILLPSIDFAALCIITACTAFSSTRAHHPFYSYMAKCTPNLKQLPVTVSVFIPGKNIKIPNLVVGPEDNIKKLREVIKSRLAEVRCSLSTG